MLLCEDLTSVAHAEGIAERILRSLEEPLEVEGRTLRQSASLERAIAGAEASASSLLAEADAALFTAKARGRSRFAQQDGASRAVASQRLETMQALHAAIGRDELVLWFQPTIPLREAGPIGAKALLRWNRDGEGAAAQRVLDVAEELGLTVPLGRWVLDSACRQAAQWSRERLGLESTAEGIESEEQLRTLMELGCDAAQGYLLCQPGPAGPSWPACSPLIDLRRDRSTLPLGLPTLPLG